MTAQFGPRVGRSRRVVFHHHPPTRQRATTSGRERGTSIVEAAIVTLAFFTMIAILFEGSGLVRDSLGVSNATKTAARTATVNGDEVYADYYILRTIRKEASAIGIDDLQRVVVYRADGFGNPPTPTCKDGTAYAGAPSTRAGACNVYTRADLVRPQTDFACKNASALDGPWCPTFRKVAESGSDPAHRTTSASTSSTPTT